MARYIDVEPLEDKLKEHIKKTESELMLGALSTFLRLLDITPTADVAPVRHGRWIEYGENKDGTHNICCSVCDGFFKSKGHANSCYTRNKYRYCHNCGARMDERKDDEID